MANQVMIDAYAHVGLPRFGSLEQVIEAMEMRGIAKAVLVLGPQVPDVHTLFTAMQAYPERLRCVGIPFGRTAEQRLSFSRLLLDAGAIGIRLESQEALGNPEVMTLLGERKRWVFAPGNQLSEPLSAMYLTWLKQFPEGRIAAPHFLRAGADAAASLSEAATELIAHPRFFPIFSRHGGMGSQLAYPHEDYLPWIQHIVSLKGWEGVLWGSEYPVLYWRNETIESAQQWLRKLALPLTDKQWDAFCRGTAERLFFSEAAPPVAQLEVEPWIDEQFELSRTVPLFTGPGLEMPMAEYARLWDRFSTSELYREGGTLAEFVRQQLMESE